MRCHARRIEADFTVPDLTAFFAAYGRLNGGGQQSERDANDYDRDIVANLKRGL